MRKCHRAGGEHHHWRKYFLDAGVVVVEVSFGIDLHPVDQQFADEGHADADEGRGNKALQRRQFQIQVLETLEHGHQADDPADQEHIHRPPALGRLKRIVGIQHQFTDAQHQQQRKRPTDDRRHDPTGDDAADLAPLHRIDTDAGDRKANQCADDGMGGRDRPTACGRDHQPDAGCQQRGQHAVHQQLRRPHDGVGIDDALANGLGDLAAGNEGAGEFKHRGDDDGVAHRDRTRTHRGAHRIGDIIGADAPGHVNAKDHCHGEEHIAPLCNNFHCLFL